MLRKRNKKFSEFFFRTPFAPPILVNCGQTVGRIKKSEAAMRKGNFL